MSRAESPAGHGAPQDARAPRREVRPCPKCGAWVEVQAVRCRTCDAKLEPRAEAEAPQAPPRAPVQIAPPEAPQTPSHATIWTNRLLGLLLAIQAAFLVQTLIPRRPTWEYRVQFIHDRDWERHPVALTDPDGLGAEGWEIVAARRAARFGSTVDGYEVILKRGAR